MLDTGVVIHATPHRLSRADYHRLIALGFFDRTRVELIHGILVDTSPIGVPHRMVVDRLNKLLLPRLLGRAEVSIQQPFSAAGDSEPEPDLTVFPSDEPRDRHPQRAFLIVEVADSSLEFDRSTKCSLYAASDVAEYWIVNLVQRVVEIYTDSVNGRYANVAHVKSGMTIAPRAFPDVTIAVAELLG